jgi:DNA replication licensing factor MCM6
MSRFDLFFILVDECNEVIDYAIARKIVDLHTNTAELVEQVYSRDDVAWYITFAKQFKPKITEEAMKLLVENYGNLRQRDTGTNSRSTWRITVRQLESMIRLSEAYAKMECSLEIIPKHVKEAYRLLNKSIIRVEQPDIHFGDDDEPMDTQPEHEQNGVENGHEENGDVTKKKFTLSFEEYKKMSNMLILHMRDLEMRAIADGSDSEEGMKKSDLIGWYLEEISSMIESEDELIERKLLIEKVIERLVTHDQVLIPLKTMDHLHQRGDEETDDEDPILVVHPNYIVE